MTQIIEKKSLKEISLKHAKFGNIYRDKIEIAMEKKLSNGLKIEWIERTINPISIYLVCRDTVKPKASRFFIDSDTIGFIKDIEIIQYCPKNNYDEKHGELLQSIYFRTKKGNLTFHNWTINGKHYRNMSVSLMTNNYDDKENNLFEKKEV